MELSNASFLPDPKTKAQMIARFEWLAGGAALMMSQAATASDPPAATWIIGRDEDGNEYLVLYNDGRGVSRVYQMSFENGTWRMWRNTRNFSQRFQGRVDADRNSISARWEKSTDGTTWQHDFDMRFSRAG